MSRLIAKRIALSVFLIGHLAAVTLTNLPNCAFKRVFPLTWVDAYLLPTGQGQSWGMFAPEPAKDTLTLEAIVRDSRGLVRHYAFPRMMDKSAWAGFWGGYRHSKYAHALSAPESRANREFAARFVVRALDLKAEDFPADVQLVYQVFPTNAPDAPADEPPASPWSSVLETYNFSTLAEAQP
jgi:hypothetical protein